MSLLARLFGIPKTESAPAAPSVTETYNGFKITAAPINENGEYRIAATVEKDGKTHQVIRADTLRDQDAATEASMAKAKQVIDEQGDRLFD